MRAHRSHSQLNTFLHCGHQYYLQKVLRLPESPSVWLPAGKAFHSTTEDFDRDVLSSDDGTAVGVNPDFYADLFTTHFEAELDELRKIEPDESKWRRAGKISQLKPNKEDIAWWHTAGREMVRDYITWRVTAADTWEIATVNGAPGIEVEVLSPVGDVPMKGWVDRVLRSKLDDRLVVVDLKSGSRTPTSPMQLALYSIQLERLMGEPVLWGGFYEARKGRLGDLIDLSVWTESLLGTVYGRLDQAITTGLFLPNIDTHCVSCGVRQFCIYQGGNENA